MKKMIAFILMLSLLLLPLEGCGSQGEGPASASAGGETRPSAGLETAAQQPEGEESSHDLSDSDAPLAMASSDGGGARPVYQAPKITPAEFHKDSAVGDPGAQIDVSAVSEGYVAVSGKSDMRLKFQVIQGEITYTYDMPNDGTPAIYGLQSGNGDYRFQIMENVSGTGYACLFFTEAKVTLKDEFQPFLRTCQFADYNSESACVKKAADLVKKSRTGLEAAQAIFSYVCDNITYDKDKAATVPKGYVPKPDETLATGKGICFDYASLAASMLRSQGIPTKIIFGYVASGNGTDLYHAWNMFYTKESGWILVDYEVKGGDWNRMDCTFAANGSGSVTIGTGTNYSDVYVY